MSRADDNDLSNSDKVGAQFALNATNITCYKCGQKGYEVNQHPNCKKNITRIKRNSMGHEIYVEKEGIVKKADSCCFFSSLSMISFMHGCFYMISCFAKPSPSLV